MNALIDTSFFLALAFQQDEHHRTARAAIRKYKGKRFVAAPVLPEAFYMIMTRVSYEKAMLTFEMIQTGGFQIEALTNLDMRRMLEIIHQYQDTEFDFVDTAIMALSERLNIRHVFTFDYRDFSVFRPRHCERLIWLP